MHWIIQDNLYAEDGTDALLGVLRRRGIASTQVAMSGGPLSPEPHPTGPVMVCGSIGLVRLAQERGWQPGSFRNANHRHQACMDHWGAAMLNADARISTFRDVEPTGIRVFIRPDEEAKLFNGCVMEADEVRAWRDALVRGERSPVRCSPRMDADALVVCGPPVTIHKECRFFAVDGAVVAWSTYKLGNEVVALSEMDPVSLDFVRAAVRHWQPARAFVLDTALTPEGPRILEVNCINSAGFYGADVENIVLAIEAMQPWATMPTQP